MAQGQRNEGIDALRGASIVLVVMHHLAIRIPLARTGLAHVLPGRLLSALCWKGYESVFVFFVISGFLIAGNAWRRWDNVGHPNFSEFYMQRFARIAPCLVVLVIILSALDLARVPAYTIDNPHQSLPGAIASAFGLSLNVFEGHTGYLPGGWDVLWSLSIEEVFYLGFPVICLLARFGNLWFVCVCLLLALSLPITRGALAGNEIWQEKAYLPGMAAIATGVLAALAARHMRPSRRTALYLMIAGGLCYGTVLFAEDLIWPFLGETTLLLLTFGVALLMLGLHFGEPPVRRLWSMAWITDFGRLSYEVYMSHMFAVFGVLAIFRMTGAANWWGFMLYPVSLALALLLGGLVARVISQPAENVLLACLMRYGGKLGRKNVLF